jgi:hypothetical protein
MSTEMVRLAESTAGTVFGFHIADERPSMDELTSRPKKQVEGWQPPILPCCDHVVHLEVPLAVHNRGYNLVGGSLFG